MISTVYLPIHVQTHTRVSTNVSYDFITYINIRRIVNYIRVNETSISTILKLRLIFFSVTNNIQNDVYNGVL